MIAIAYRSNSHHPYSEDEILQLADSASLKNERLNITGYLFFRNKQFLQYIEGPEAQLRSLYLSISNDSRHSITHTIELTRLQRRIFPSWHMRYITPELSTNKIPVIEDELGFILKTASEEKLANEQFGDAFLTVTSRLASLDFSL